MERITYLDAFGFMEATMPYTPVQPFLVAAGRVHVIGCCSAMRPDDIPDRLAFKGGVSVSASGWINPGDSAIVDPDGKVLAGPLHEEQGLLLAEVDPQRITGPRWQLDVAGHYSRPDVLELVVRGRGTSSQP